MSSRVLPFFAGCAFSLVMVLNHTYETELVKKQLREEIEMLRRMRDFQVDQVATFRTAEQPDVRKLANHDVHYRYFWTCLLNASRERVMSIEVTPTLRQWRNQVVTYSKKLSQ